MYECKIQQGEGKQVNIIQDMTFPLINDLTTSLINDLINDLINPLINPLINDLINDLINPLIIDLINDFWHLCRYMRPCFKALLCGLHSFPSRWMFRN